MSLPEPVLADSEGLVDVVDHLMNRGAVVSGEAMITLAGVDLMYLRLNLLLASVSTLEKSGVLSGTLARGFREARIDAEAPAPEPETLAPSGAEPRGAEPRESRLLGAAPAMDSPGTAPVLPGGHGATPEKRTEQGLAQLVLTLVELLRELMERQAIRRMETGGLPDEQVERMGIALRDMEAKVSELREMFGLKPEDLRLDLGPLGRVM